MAEVLALAGRVEADGRPELPVVGPNGDLSSFCVVDPEDRTPRGP